MARISGLPEDSSPFTRLAYALTRRRLGRMVETVAISAHHPRLLLGAAAFEQALGGAHRLDDRVEALAILQTASRIGCPF